MTTMRNEKGMIVIMTRIASISIVLALFFVAAAAFSASAPPPAAVLYPKDRSVVGEKVNVVLDPAVDWTSAPLFQVVVNGRELAVMDAGTGRHAAQGVVMGLGINTITVRHLAPAPVLEGRKKKETQPAYTLVSIQTLTVFNREGNFASTPERFLPNPFHSREREADCSGCHRLDVEPADYSHAKPEDVLCQSCHRQMAEGKHIHGPAAVWNCLACHDPELYPLKYTFASLDPWKVTKSTQAVEPPVFTIPTDALFVPDTATLLPKLRTQKAKQNGKKKQDKSGDAAKEALRVLLMPLLEHVTINPGDRVRIEAHTDSTPLPKPKGKKQKGFATHQALTEARAAVVSSIVKQFGITGKNRVIAVGMGDKLPKAPNVTKEGRAANNRIEIVAYPAGVTVANSLKLPLLHDRERVVVSVSYASREPVNKLAIMEKLPKGVQYLKGTGTVKGAPREPQVKGSEVVWRLGENAVEFNDTISYVVKKTKAAGQLPAAVTLTYRVGKQDITREIDPSAPKKKSLTVKETCMTCHLNIVSGEFKHGPVDAGYCSLCHDPHASHNPAWLRKSAWDLCTTCHADLASGVHVVAGFVSGSTHPTKGKRDTARPGKRLSCASCHAPHSAPHPYLFAYGKKTRHELCGMCHPKK